MVKFLYSWFSWVPIVGGIFKGLYVASLVKKLKDAASNRPLPESIRNKTGAELDEALADEANSLMTEVLEPLDLGLVADLVRRAAVDSVVSILRKSVVS